MEPLKFRIAFNLLPTVQPDLIAHLSGYRKRDWPTVIAHLAQSALAGTSVAIDNQRAVDPVSRVTQLPQSGEVGKVEAPKLRQLSPEEKRSAFFRPAAK